jgi:hypothetical protein
MRSNIVGFERKTRKRSDDRGVERIDRDIQPDHDAGAAVKELTTSSGTTQLQSGS